MKTTRSSVVAFALGILIALDGCDPMDMMDRVGSCGVYGSDAACNDYSDRYQQNQAAAANQYQRSQHASEMERLQSKYVDQSPATSINMANWSWLNGTWCDHQTHAETFIFDIKASGNSAMHIYNAGLKQAYAYAHTYTKDYHPMGYYVAPRYVDGFYEIWHFGVYGEEFYKTKTIISKTADNKFFIKSNALMLFAPEYFEPVWLFGGGKSVHPIRDSSNKTEVYSYYKCGKT